jgi:hypothetical protein
VRSEGNSREAASLSACVCVQTLVPRIRKTLGTRWAWRADKERRDENVI